MPDLSVTDTQVRPPSLHNVVPFVYKFEAHALVHNYMLGLIHLAFLNGKGQVRFRGERD